MVSCDFWRFPKLKSPLKGKRFQTIDEIQENTTGQLMATGRNVCGPQVPTLKGTEASLSYLHCFMYLVSPLMNVSIFHITWLISSGQSSYRYTIYSYIPTTKPHLFDTTIVTSSPSEIKILS